jgi:hypothetical protein
MNDSYLKRFWLKILPKLLASYWFGVAVYTVILKPDSGFVVTQMIATITMIYGMAIGFSEGIRECSKDTLENIREIERNYVVTYTRRDKDE